MYPPQVACSLAAPVRRSNFERAPGLSHLRFDNDPRHNRTDRGIGTAITKLEALRFRWHQPSLSGGKRLQSAPAFDESKTVCVAVVD